MEEYGTVMVDCGDGDTIEIGLEPFDDADVIIALLGGRYVDFAARTGIAIRAGRDGIPESAFVEGSDDVVVLYSGSGEEERYEGYESDGGHAVVVFDFSAVLPPETCGASVVMDALDAVAGEVL